MDENNRDFLLKINDIHKKISKHIRTIVRYLKPFLTKDKKKRIRERAADIQKIYKSSLLLKQELIRKLKKETLIQKLHDANFSEYLAKTRHDLRNHLNIIQGYAEIALEEFQKKSKNNLIEQFQEIITLSKQMLNLVDEIRIKPLQLIILPLSPSTDILKERFIDENFKKMASILIVDDVKENCQLLKRYLNHIGYKNTAVAKSGFQALSMLKKNKFDLVLLDIDMPGMTGMDILIRLKDDINQRRLMAIMISGSDTMENIIECIKLGAEDFLSKPFNVDILRARVDACIEKKWFIKQETLHQEQLEMERRRYETLLSAVFPTIIVNELAITGKIQAKQYENVAILFADVVNFTTYCDTHELEESMKNIQDFADMCETIAIKYNIQKIKTVGDSFLATAGMLTENVNPVLDCIHCAQELITQSAKLAAKWKLRIGINFGTVIGGIVGHRQYLFDIWGDAVNTAARIQSIAEPGKIFLSKAAWNQVHELSCGRSLGELALKGKAPEEIFIYEKSK